MTALRKSPERFTDVAWEGDNATSYRVELQVDAWDRTRLLEDLSRTFVGGRGQHHRGLLHDQAPDGQEPVRGRGRRLASSCASASARLRNVDSVFDAYRVTPDRLSLERDELRPAGGQRRGPVPRRRRTRRACSRGARPARSSGDGDELIVADNTRRRVAAGALGGVARVVRATRASAPPTTPATRARAAARNDWLLFMDADCVPRPGLLDAYFAEPVAGRLRGARRRDRRRPGQRTLCSPATRARDASSSGRRGLSGPRRGTAPTGNLLVRRAAFDAVGGFTEGIRSGGDVDLCRRLQAAGWLLEHRPGAVVAHRHRESLPAFLGMIARYGAGARWLNERYPGSSPRWPLPSAGLARRGPRRRLACAAAGELEAAAVPRHRRPRPDRPQRRLPARAIAPRLGSTSCRDAAARHRSSARIASPVVRACSSLSYLCRGQKNPRSPSLRFRGTRWTWRWGTLWLTTLFRAMNAPCGAHRRRGSRPRAVRAFANSGPTGRRAGPRASRGGRGGPAASGRGTAAGGRGRRARLVLEDDARPRPRRRRSRRRRQPSADGRRSGNDRQRAGLDRRARARRGRRCSRRPPGPGTARMLPSASRETRLDPAPR